MLEDDKAAEEMEDTRDEARHDIVAVSILSMLRMMDDNCCSCYLGLRLVSD